MMRTRPGCRLRRTFRPLRVCRAAQEACTVTQNAGHAALSTRLSSSTSSVDNCSPLLPQALLLALRRPLIGSSPSPVRRAACGGRRWMSCCQNERRVCGVCVCFEPVRSSRSRDTGDMLKHEASMIATVDSSTGDAAGVGANVRGSELANVSESDRPNTYVCRSSVLCSIESQL